VISPRHVLTRFWQALVDLCYPPHCAGCRRDTISGSHVCAACAEEIERIERPFCERCSNPFAGAITEKFVCPNCEGRQVHFEHAVAPFRSRGIVRECIHAFKYQRAQYLRPQLSAWLAEALCDSRIADRPFDAFVPVPLHAVRQREREYNQAEELCRDLSARANRPTWKALRRIRYTTTQTKLDREERMENLRGAFQVSDNALVKDRDLVLVDDVFTTGSTVEECSRVLLRGGARSVRVICVARG
jgi:competence protein ComFC